QRRPPEGIPAAGAEGKRIVGILLMSAGADHELLEVNRRFYDPLWTDAHLVEPERFNTWPLVDSLLSRSLPRLEIAPGLRPRLPIDGTQFVDISMPAIAKLRARGAS